MDGRKGNNKAKKTKIRKYRCRLMYKERKSTNEEGESFSQKAGGGN